MCVKLGRRLIPAVLRRSYRYTFQAYWFPRYRWADKKAAEYGVLAVDPPVFYVPYWVDYQLYLNQSLTPLFDHLANTRAYFLYKWIWWIEEPERVDIVKRFEHHHHRRYPKHQFIHLCNTLRQYEVFREGGLNAIFCNENAFLDEKIFFHEPGVPKSWDAVYDARFKSYKRHELAVHVSSLALIYDVNPHVDDPAYVERVRGQFAYAHFFNHDKSGAYIKLTTSQLNTSLNECRVGLCLSEAEGANAASMQYLLCGMPVVSTKSRGGRDVFFDDDYVLIVDDSADAVSAGVQAMLKREHDPEMIRNRTLEKREPHRRALIDCVQDIYDREGVPRQFAAEWDAVYFHKLARYQRHVETFARLEAARRKKASGS